MIQDVASCLTVLQLQSKVYIYSYRAACKGSLGFLIIPSTFFKWTSTRFIIGAIENVKSTSANNYKHWAQQGLEENLKPSPSAERLLVCMVGCHQKTCRPCWNNRCPQSSE
ncbi:hypothetical protein E3U43_019113 [Larimichthys crocea]|uniref:Uncharacterized protein n=1 Tax=Larimichthys crocea TaxID=215358 RepID=A0ACD3QWK5_LARCR|nr:hypothetical protein E3U43_019113 [Larimichthys crocea]